MPTPPPSVPSDRSRAPAVLALLVISLILAGPVPAGRAQGSADRPNILWITAEDISPDLGCFGSVDAVTPTLDALAASGVRYTAAFAPIGVCAPARSCLVTGMYPTSLGTHHMRCRGRLPRGFQCFPELLRGAGYYCTNNAKTDYNFVHPKATWDRSGRNAHWRRRPEGRPFFAVFNDAVTHESRVRANEPAFQRMTRQVPSAARHRPEAVGIPPYHPDTPAVRRDWARYHDLITALDLRVKRRLEELQADGLEDDTIVFFFSDHGAGLPRSKRWLYDSGMRVPLIVRFPERWAHLAPGPAGSRTDRLVSFVDFGPTVLSLAGVEIPPHLQGKAFLGPRAAPPRTRVFGFRGRMDERYDMQRAVRDRRYKYIRNFMPHVEYAQHIEYMFEMPTMQEWVRARDAGELRGPQRRFLATTKPKEELYDTWADPWEVHDLSGDPDHLEVRNRLAAALWKWMEETRDTGLLPESDLRSRFGDEAPYDAIRGQPDRFPLATLLAAARDVGGGPEATIRALSRLEHPDPAVRWWGLTHLAGRELDETGKALVSRLTEDPSPAVRLAAARVLLENGEAETARAAAAEHVDHAEVPVRLRAIDLLDRLGVRARPVLPALRAALADPDRDVKKVARHAVRAFEGR